jgi:glycosyltransferase involved in cell wall biosynthesis
VTIADTMRDEIVARGIVAEKVTVIPNAVDAETFRPREADATLRRRYGLDAQTVVGYVGNLDHPREGHELLIDATARLVRRGCAVKCLIVGDGRRRADLQHRVDRSGLGESVVFTGAVSHDEVPAHYALIDVFVVPRAEDRAARYVTPLKPFEAMAMERPLVVSDLPALAEIAGVPERGLSFPAGDVEALAKTIETLIERPELRRSLGEAGRRWVLSERTWARNAERYRGIYGSLRERRPPTPARELSVASGAG